MTESLRERGRRRAAEQGIPLAPPPTEHAADLIPEADAPARSPEQDDVDRILDQFGIVEAYNKWCGKSVPAANGRTESIMVSCPTPGHADAHPSAWLNSDIDTWFCGGCQTGGDKFDIAAWHFGMDVPGYKSREQFPELRRRMAEELGYVIRRTTGGQETVQKIEEGDEGAEIIQMPTSHDPTQTAFRPEIKWQEIIPAGTFLWDWMTATSENTTSPNEYYFWLGLMAVGAAAGPDAVLVDEVPVKGNLFVCLVGPSGAGKSRSAGALTALLRRALPYDPDDPHSTGIKLAAPAASGEALIHTHQKIEYDPTDPKVIVGYHPVRSLIQYNEMSDLVGRAARLGNSLKPILMQFYDALGDISTDSRTSGQITAASPYGQFLSTTQTRALGGLLTRSDAYAGMLNRIVFAQGVEKPRRALGTMTLDIEPAVRPLMLIRTWASSGRSVTVSPEAEALLEEWFRREFLPRTSGDDANPILARCDLLMKKIMFLLAVNERSQVVTEDMARRALALWPYIKGCYGIIERRLNADDMTTEEAGELILTAIREWQDSTGKSPSLRDLYERKLKRKIRDRNLMLKTLNMMVAIGELEEVVVKTANGKTTTRYRWTESG